MMSCDVRVWQVRVNKNYRQRSYTVRWTVARRERSRTFATRALADRFRSDLFQAMNRGEGFDLISGMPESMDPARKSRTWLTFAQEYVAMKWPAAAAKTRVAMVESLVAATIGLLGESHGLLGGAELRASVRELLRPAALRTKTPPAAMANAWQKLARVDLAVRELDQPLVLRRALDALGRTASGAATADTTLRRRRAVLYNALQYAVELRDLPSNPIDRIMVPARRVKISHLVDRTVVVNPQQADELLMAVTYVGRRQLGHRLHALFACMYFAALRPAEALGLRERDCFLPPAGWGRLVLESTRPLAGKRWTDSGRAHDERCLKHRGRNETRTVPIPLQLSAILRSHIDRFGLASDGRLFHTASGGVVASSTYWRVWHSARTYALTPLQVASPLARRPYDLRHACVSLWLNAGVPAPDVAERAGHSVEVLLKIYARCIDGQTDANNARIERALHGAA
jgi:integrase